MFADAMKRLNERRTAEFEGEEVEAGFTLIELMVVLLILAILLAIAIPTFLGVTNTANNRAAQSNLNTALTDAKSVYESDQQSYPTTASALATAIQKNEPSLGILTNTTTAGAGQVITYVDPSGNAAVLMSEAKKTNLCWWVADNTQAITALSTPVGWVATTSPTAPGPFTGIPGGTGEWYGVYKTPTGVTCDPTTLTTTPGYVSNVSFPAASLAP